MFIDRRAIAHEITESPTRDVSKLSQKLSLI
jgi:hypothetical protein